MIPSSTFDLIILAVIAVGVVLAALRMRHDFRQGSRFTGTTPESSTNTSKTKGTRS